MKNLLLAFCFCLSTLAFAESPLDYGGFIDGYYAYSLQSPASKTIAYSTQANRHNQPNFNLVYAELKLQSEDWRGRFALQSGTSVQANYGAESLKNIQEAYVGYRLSPQWWMDAGIMLSHLGMESFISKDNPTYLRSLVADYSPYYQTGIRSDFKVDEKLSFQILFLNGWQNISLNGFRKSLGTQISYALNPSTTLLLNSFYGEETAFRHFHDFILKLKFNEHHALWLQGDVGSEADKSAWGGFSLIHHWKWTERFSTSSRIEFYSDPSGVIIPISNGPSFSVWGASLGMNYHLPESWLFRLETRSLNSSAAAHDQSAVAISAGYTI